MLRPFSCPLIHFRSEAEVSLVGDQEVDEEDGSTPIQLETSTVLPTKTSL
jgi:hypothetical protein